MTNAANRPAIKFCGLNRPEDIACANFLQPDYVGFVFWPKSPRAITVGEAEALRALLNKKVTPVGVFVEAKRKTIRLLFEEGIISVAHLYGNEDQAYVKKLREKVPGLVIWKTFLLKSEKTIKEANKSAADFVLFIVNPDDDVDWELLDQMNRPYGLTGGLTPDNVGKALANTSCVLVDVNHGIEDEPLSKKRSGLKSEQKMKTFYRAVKHAAKEGESQAT